MQTSTDALSNARSMLHTKAIPLLALSLLAGACDAAIVAQANKDTPPPSVQAEAAVEDEAKLEV
ncbi:MAG TPA: hypothetical protein VGB85_28855, partial [Nannocystis sp.]